MAAATSSELDGGLPAGFYEQLSTPLILAHIVCYHAFQYPATPFTREVAALTALDAEFVATMHALDDNATLAEVMQEQPELFLWYLQLSQQLLASSLGRQLTERLRLHSHGPPQAPLRTPPPCWAKQRSCWNTSLTACGFWKKISGPT